MTWRPHEVPPLTLYADYLELPPSTHIRAENRSPQLIENLSVCDFLSETDPRSGQEWSASVVRRLVGASSGPVAVGIRDDHVRARLENAGWFVAAQEANFGEAREHCWPALPTCRRLAVGYGNPRPSLVLVADRATRHGQLPMASRSGTWLFLALRYLGYDELSVYVCNARDVKGRRRGTQLTELHDAFGEGVPWVGMGRAAQDVLRGAKLPHHKVVHPSHHKRWKYAEDVKGFAERFEAAGVPRGPYAVEPIGGVIRVDTLPDLREPYRIRNLATKGNVKPVRNTGGVSKSPLHPKKREAARRAFITGEAKTLREAAEIAGCHVDRLRPIARDQGWRAELDEHQRAITIAAKKADKSGRAENMHKATSLACYATRLGMADVVERLLAGRGNAGALAACEKKGVKPLHPVPRDLESLARTSLALLGADTSELSAAEANVQSMNPMELARETIRVLQEQFGEDA